ncbi:uncharacterized protein LOC141856765 [Brevipalpus obovatus]|uniref:uncharacterized protein LOC141856765 n=1 Tax=Brevipalpus obovatus TaxID=246614 RepID=UPI003D9E2839
MLRVSKPPPPPPRYSSHLPEGHRGYDGRGRGGNDPAPRGRDSGPGHGGHAQSADRNRRRRQRRRSEQRPYSGRPRGGRAPRPDLGQRDVRRDDHPRPGLEREADRPPVPEPLQAQVQRSSRYNPPPSGLNRHTRRAAKVLYHQEAVSSPVTNITLSGINIARGATLTLNFGGPSAPGTQ